MLFSACSSTAPRATPPATGLTPEGLIVQPPVDFKLPSEVTASSKYSYPYIPSDPNFLLQGNITGDPSVSIDRPGNRYAAYRTGVLLAYAYSDPVALEVTRPLIGLLDTGVIRMPLGLRDGEIDSLIDWDNAKGNKPKDFLWDRYKGRSTEDGYNDDTGAEDLTLLGGCAVNPYRAQQYVNHLDGGHGNEMASIIAGVHNNSIGGAGVVPEADILSLRVSGCGTSLGYLGLYGGYLTDETYNGDIWNKMYDNALDEVQGYVDAIKYAISRNVSVINISVGGPVHSYKPYVAGDSRYDAADPPHILNACNKTLRGKVKSSTGTLLFTQKLDSEAVDALDDLADAFEQAYAAGIPVFVAAGNHNFPGSSGLHDPGLENFLTTCPHVITVTATDGFARLMTQSNSRNVWSDPHAKEWLVAVDIEPTAAQKYTREARLGGPDVIKYRSVVDYSAGGTSSATAIASGVAALMKIANPAITPDQIAYIMKFWGSFGPDVAGDPNFSYPTKNVCTAVVQKRATLTTPVGSPKWNTQDALKNSCGFSMLDAAKAVYFAAALKAGTISLPIVTAPPRDPSAPLYSVLNPGPSGF